MNLPTFQSMDDIQQWAVSELLRCGTSVAPRQIGTTELAPAWFTLRNPRARYTSLAKRKWKLSLAVGEFCWHSSGSDDVAWIAWYAPRWREFSDDNRIVRGSCYGKRVFTRSNGQPTQWERVLSTLRGDPASRRAVLYFDGPAAELMATALDFPCASSLQFLIRENRLHGITSMRSNDVIWGLPYDVFLFTMLQERMAAELGVELGSYYHFAGSLHLYDHHIPLARAILDDVRGVTQPMPPMEDPRHLDTFLKYESQLRAGSLAATPRDQLFGYWADLFDVLVWHSRYRSAGHDSRVSPASIVQNSLYRRLVELGYDVKGSPPKEREYSVDQL